MTFLKVLLLLILLKCIALEANGTAKFGPYKATVFAVKQCKRAARYEDKNAFVHVYVEAFNSTRIGLLRGNVTVFKDNQNVKIKSKRFLWENDKWNLNLAMNNIGCHGIMMQIMCASVGIKYDREKCSFHKGTYAFKDLDSDRQLHLWTNSMEYGQMLWKFEVYSPSGIASCVELELVIEPL